MLHVHDLSLRAGERLLVQELRFTAAGGEFIAILGRNGCGKSLTLHTLAGLRGAQSGRIELDGTDLATMKRPAIARRLGLLPQDREESLPLSLLEATLTGRHPHLRLWQQHGAQDEQIARDALASFGLGELQRRALLTLSGGEQRRAAMAALLAQQPAVYLLDEPTNHLDPHQQLQVLTLFRSLCMQGATVIATLHDPSLADRFADRVLLMHGDGRWQLGASGELLNATTLSELYLTPLMQLGEPGRRAFIPA
ncbi:MAG: ABC transporter ATP-binding protein [Steroidobacteraceae bacterium]